MAKEKTTFGKGNGANLGFEADLWRAADALRSNMDAAEYKHVVLGLDTLIWANVEDIGYGG
jgi:type I restriction enzyme M protein